MMRFLALPPILALLAVTGCAYQRTYSHPTATQEQLNKDEYECTKDAYNAGGLGSVAPGGGQGRALNIPLLNQCMKSKGYTWKESGMR